MVFGLVCRNLVGIDVRRLFCFGVGLVCCLVWFLVFKGLCWVVSGFPFG